MLIRVAGTKGGMVNPYIRKNSQKKSPENIEAIAPILLDFFQYNPSTKGAKRDTKLNMEDSPTNS